MIMSSKFVTSGSLSLTLALAFLGAAADADNINTNGVVCQNYNASQALDIDYLPNGVRNVNASPRFVICAVPRSPLTTNPSPTFYVDGENAPGTSTSCTVFVYNYLGTFVSSQSFTRTVPSTGTTLDWDQPVVLPSPPSTFDYVSLLCSIPGNRGGLIRGVTVVQP
jgi:hypothetical protein